MKTVIIMQARMTSHRLPGKIMKLLIGQPMMAFELERLCEARLADEVMVATTVNESDELVATLCQETQVPCFRGSEADVLERYYGAAKSSGASVVVRVTADCPLIDPAIVDHTIDFYRQNAARYDYVSNVLTRTFPRGLDCEVFSWQALERANREAKLEREREHVTPYIYNHPELFRLASITNAVDESRHRWTVDTAEDLELIQKIVAALYPASPHFRMQDVLQLLAQHPEWLKINQNVRQKTLGDEK